MKSETVALMDPEELEDATAPAHAYCTGVWVDELKILTAAHCTKRSDRPAKPLFVATISDAFRYRAYEPAYKPALRPVFVIGLDKDHDLAMLVGMSGDFERHGHAITRVTSVVQTGDRVTTMGHSDGVWLWSYSSGDVAAIRRFDGTLYVQTTAPTSHGNSGGGLFNSKGELVGLGHGIDPDGSNLAFYVHPIHIQEFLAKHGLLF